MAEIDPVKFGELCANVENTNARLGELCETLKEYSAATTDKLDMHSTQISQIEKDVAVKKGAVLAVLGTGTVAGLTLPEGLKKVLEALGKAFS